VLSVLAGGMTIAEAAWRNKTSETSVGKWKAQFRAARPGRTAQLPVSGPADRHPHGAHRL
jgi:transposase